MKFWLVNFKDDQRLGLLQAQFNLELSEKERIDRAKVVLPFEHQGDDKDGY